MSSDVLRPRLATTTESHYDSPGVATTTTSLVHWWFQFCLSAAVIGWWPFQCCVSVCEWSVALWLRPHCSPSTSQRRQLVSEHRLLMNKHELSWVMSRETWLATWWSDREVHRQTHTHTHTHTHTELWRLPFLLHWLPLTRTCYVMLGICLFVCLSVC